MKKQRLYIILTVLSWLFASHTALPVYAATSTADGMENVTTTTAIVTTTDASSTSPEANAPLEGHSIDGTYERAIVQDVQSSTQQSAQGAQQMRTFIVQYLSGPNNGKTVQLSNTSASNPYNLEPQPGDKILLFVQPNPEGGDPLVYLEGFDRRNAIYVLIGVFVAVMVALAGWQGIKTAASIFLSVALIGLVLIPSFLKGINPIPVAFALSVVFAGISSVFAMGWNRKSFVTVVGTLGGAFVAYVIALVFADWAHLNGLSTEEDRLFFDKNPLLNPRGLLFAGIIIASMGVVEDVAVSIASGVQEVRQANPRMTFKSLFRSGMVIGRDHMAALANTLVFAYVGASISSLLLYSQYGGSWAKFMNFDSVVDEIIRSMAGTIGLVFTVPITALLAAWFALRPERITLDPVKEVTGYRPKDTAH